LNEMEAQNEKIISNLMIKLEREKKKRAEDSRKAKKEKKKVEDSDVALHE